MGQDNSYDFFKEFVERYLPVGFLGISRDDPFMVNMEKVLKQNNQFFYIADLIRIKVLFTSNMSREIIGVDPEEVDPSSMIRLTHPNDYARHNLAKVKIIKTGHDIFYQKAGEEFMSLSLRSKNPQGTYSDILFQGYVFYVPPPHENVFLLLVLTDISSKGWRKMGYHYYTGTDSYFFRYPDEELIRVGRLFSDREFEIIKMLAAGLSSEAIAAKTFLSVHTINTHRRNILRKSRKESTNDLILDLKESGVL